MFVNNYFGYAANLDSQRERESPQLNQPANAGGMSIASGEALQA